MADSASVPVVHHLRDVYADAHKAAARYSALTAHFLALYGCSPAFYARAPGRVNLIGEHIDYSGYSVLPMAIDRDTVIAAALPSSSSTSSSSSAASPSPSSSPSASSSSVQLANYDQAYPAVTFDDSSALLTIATQHHWTKYVQCGFKGVSNEVEATSNPTAPSPSSSSSSSSSLPQLPLQLLVNGTVPPSAGLSSSSSLVCASALTAVYAHHLHTSFTRAQLADIASRCERYVGTMGGGMDQAISFLSERGVAQRIDFDPLRNVPVQLPADAVFVVCNSLYESEKAVQAATQFNARVLECKLAALLLARHFHMQVTEQSIPQLTLKKVQLHSGLSAAQLARELEQSQLLRPAPYTVAEVEAALGLSLSTSLSYNANFAKVLSSPPPLLLHQRALHVYTEAQRVFDFQSVCAAPTSHTTLTTLGQLMDSSHASCRDLYDCSCPDLDRLVAVTKAAGALGCRLTGAGWGGCVVALFDGAQGQRRIDEAIDAIARTYYLQHKGVQLTDPRMSEYIFTTSPSTGAAVYVPEGGAGVGDKRGSWGGGWVGWGTRALVMVGLGVMTGLVLALLNRHSNRRLAHATGVTTSHAIAAGAVQPAPAMSIPILR